MIEPIPSAAAGARVLSNGRFFSLFTAAGAGYASAGKTALTRWQGDPVEDGDGCFVLLRDLDSGAVWSVGRLPMPAAGARYASGGTADSAWIACIHNEIEAHLTVTVDPQRDAEVRTLALRNLDERPRRIEVTSYLEVVLNARAAEASHPAFSKLFVQTELLPSGALLARRRPRGADEQPLWLVHAVDGGTDPQWETDRKAFIGRGRSIASPAAFDTARLAGTVGNVLDPVLSLRRSVTLPAQHSASLRYVLGAAATRDGAIALADAREPAARGVRPLAAHTGIEAAAAARYEELAVAILYGEPALHGAPDAKRRATGSPAVLGEFRIPGDAALCAALVDDPHASWLAELMEAARWWQALGLPLHVVMVGDCEALPEHGDNVTVLDPARVPPADVDRVLCLAHAVLRGALPRFAPVAAAAPTGHAPVDVTQPRAGAPDGGQGLQCFNGHGGFANGGREYVIRMPWNGSGLQLPPLPWTNVIANEKVGVIVSETGAGYTWSRNSREHRLTPWSNDPVRDPHGEAFYLRDEETGAFWSPLPGPAPAKAAYETVHGFGYSQFRHASHGIAHETTVFVPRHDALRIVRIVLRNESGAPRKLSVYGYHQLVLGGTRTDSGRHVVTEHTVDALLATNGMAGPFLDGVTFVAPVAAQLAGVSVSADRAGFMGAQGTSAAPAALRQPRLDGRIGAGLDPCAAFQVPVELAPGASIEVTFLLGEATSRADALALVQRYRAPGAVAQALDEVRAFWERTVGTVQVDTPSPAIDLMLNGWLTYQNLSCRIWGRSAFYQSGGAIGYRDQLQDSSAMMYADPALTRRQIRLHAAHQFVEGDVLHWWHPQPLEKGLRTRFADDLLWMPWIAAFYINSTGDWTVLDEVEPFLEAPQLADGEDEVFLKPQVSRRSASVYEHCCLALDRSLTSGAHGLPLFGTGDWNDGMNRVGRKGRGESVWMGFFLYRIITDFLPICERRGDRLRVERYGAYRNHLQRTLNDAGWDGDWYRRAFYDNGAVMGSKDSDECKIDALAQAWSVISGAATPQRAEQALDAVERQLVSDEDRLIRLLTPPFVNTPQDPGYIKGYVAGVRENGGQYTHAACWVVRAFAELGRGERAARLLEMLSPVTHAANPAQVAQYQVEPYVIAADIYGAEPHVGRGGWTWYTGSAGWMFRVGVESVLGVTLRAGTHLRVAPVVPSDWPGFSVTYTPPGQGTVYRIRVTNPGNVANASVTQVRVNGAALPPVDGAALIPLASPGEHIIDIELGAR